MPSLFDQFALDIRGLAVSPAPETALNALIQKLLQENEGTVDISEVKPIWIGNKPVKHRFTLASWLMYQEAVLDPGFSKFHRPLVNQLKDNGANPIAIVEGYVLGFRVGMQKYHEEDDATYTETMRTIVRAFAMKGRLFNDEDRFFQKYGPNIYIDVAEGYARAGREKELNDLLKKEYPKNNDIINGSLRGLIIAGNMDSMEALRVKYAVGAGQMAELYVTVASEGLISEQQVPPFYRAIQTLQCCRNTIETDSRCPAKHSLPALIESMERLYKGQQSRFNPYWMNSRAKLDKIIHAINALDFNVVVLDDEIRNPESALYKAMNIQRITPITFFGFNHARSVMKVEDALKMPQQHRPS